MLRTQRSTAGPTEATGWEVATTWWGGLFDSQTEPRRLFTLRFSFRFRRTSDDLFVTNRDSRRSCYPRLLWSRSRGSVKEQWPLFLADNAVLCGSGSAPKLPTLCSLQSAVLRWTLLFGCVFCYALRDRDWTSCQGAPTCLNYCKGWGIGLGVWNTLQEKTGRGPPWESLWKTKYFKLYFKLKKLENSLNSVNYLNYLCRPTLFQIKIKIGIARVFTFFLAVVLFRQCLVCLSTKSNSNRLSINLDL